MQLDEAINETIKNNFEIGDYFDSHAVINGLLVNKKYHQLYMDFYPKNCTVAQYHGQIAQKIASSGIALKVKIDEKDILIKTYTIYGELSENHLWKRI
ncbi:hypothetical protein MSI_07880 [Treponema sp. JC4]|uniref:hypothetical protein n=1 Tax=Treponema sp. JC4 TaxID=1124982 RepID=UPI00025B0A38|nr:hypothetical protein [Treponema sp. JC4]EID86435.1 hypothetical protein MSI_07880 [Treponema sp. JC4]